MTLRNLVGISLETITPTKETIRRLLDGLSRAQSLQQTTLAWMKKNKPELLN